MITTFVDPHKGWFPRTLKVLCCPFLGGAYPHPPPHPPLGMDFIGVCRLLIQERALSRRGVLPWSDIGARQRSKACVRAVENKERWRPYSKSPTVLGSVLGPLIL